MTGSAAQEPAVCRIVHYVQRGSADGVYAPRCASAMIVETGTGRTGDPDAEAPASTVNLVVWASKGGSFPELGVAYDAPEGREALRGTWHWHTDCRAGARTEGEDG